MTKPKVKTKKQIKLVSLSVLDKKLDALNLRITIIIKAQGQSLDYINTTVGQLDKIILDLAKRTLANRSDEKEKRRIDKLKVQAWTLLEKLEDYCVTSLNISIW